MKVHVLHPINPPDMAATLELWLDDHPDIQILHMVQSQDGPGWVTLTIIFK
jgi:hypothetical protein